MDDFIMDDEAWFGWLRDGAGGMICYARRPGHRPFSWEDDPLWEALHRARRAYEKDLVTLVQRLVPPEKGELRDVEYLAIRPKC